MMYVVRTCRTFCTLRAAPGSKQKQSSLLGPNDAFFLGQSVFGPREVLLGCSQSDSTPNAPALDSGYESTESGVYVLTYLRRHNDLQYAACKCRDTPQYRRNQKVIQLLALLIQ